MKFSKINTKSVELNRIQDNIDNVITSLQDTSIILKNIKISTGENKINHLLGRKLIGWQIIRLRSQANIYDNQDNNKNEQLTLILISDQDTVIDLKVF